MTVDIIPNPFWRFPITRPLWEEDDDMMHASSQGGGLSISEDEKYIYVEAAVPGIDPKDVEITFDKGALWIKGEAKEEKKDKKYYRKATRSFSYRIMVPGDLDPNQEPEASCKNGVMTVKFAKSPKSQPKKITVKM